jgi:dihydropteroate synthase
MTSLSFNNNLTWIFDKPYLMGIINLTWNSFFDGGRYQELEKFKKRIKEMKMASVDIIDLGAESSRPGASSISSQEELSHLLPKLECIKELNYDIPISIDTYKVEVAEKCIELGANLINDITAGEGSYNEMFLLCRQKNIPIVLMHKKGSPKTMQKNIFYKDVVDEVYHYLNNRVNKALSYGMRLNQLLIDVGIGFGKKLEHNLALLKMLPLFKKIGVGILVGASRKSMLGDITNRLIEERLSGSLAVNLAALNNGCDIIRCHDVVEMRDVISVYYKIKDYVH